MSQEALVFNLPLVKRLVDALLRKALDKGTKSWDIAWTRYTSILLAVTLTPRKTIYAWKANDSPPLHWGDIKMKVQMNGTNIFNIHVELLNRATYGFILFNLEG